MADARIPKSKAIARAARRTRGRPWVAAALLLASTVLSGCSVGPTYHRPVVALPAHFNESTGSHAEWPSKDWWEGFGSPQLDAYITQADSQNFDIAAAIARVQEADAQARIAGAALLPSVTGGGATSVDRVINTRAATPNAYHLGDLGVDASYEVDFWGKNHDTLEAAKQTAMAAAYNQQVIALAVTSSVAMTYFQALALQDQITVARNNLAAAQQMLTGIQMEFVRGLTTELNIQQQQTVVDTLRASIPPLQLQLSQATDRLAILLGEPPENIKLQSGSLLDLKMPGVAPGLPADLLARRPDVHEAEAELIAANANIKAARAAFLPSFTLTGQYGLESVGLASFAPPTAIFALGAGLVQPIFEGGALTGQLEYSKARDAELLDDYRKSIVSALGNVEDGLAAVQRTGQQLSEQTDVVKTAQRAYEISEAQYKAGTIDLLTVLTTETALFQAQQMFIQVRLAHAQALVGLFQALGGGWQSSLTEQTPD
jgi:multidrug efflux system outer membrane protein